MLKDGFPLFGGFSGSLDILQIPPLDLRQVEYIKGSASTLYGGGAIGGLVNLLTKRADKNETLLHLNMSHIGAKDFNAFVSRRFGKFGFTNLASMHLHSPYDADNDGYSDVPEVTKFNFNPKLFYYPDNKTELYLGADIMIDNRAGGDMKLIDNRAWDSLHFYLDKQKSKRFTSQFSLRRKFNDFNSITLKNSVSNYDRLISISQDPTGNRSDFSGVQVNSFSELNYNFSKKVHNLNIGLNLYTYDFKEKDLDTIQLRDQQNMTYGAYVNHLWDVHPKFSTELGFRADYAQAGSKISENTGEFFALPRLSMLYKINRSFSTRLGGGMGYRMPSVFSEEAEPFGYLGVQAVDFAKVKSERSYGANLDFKYLTTFGSDNVLLTFNQMFFYNLIENPILLSADSTGSLTYQNGTGPLNTRGFESQIKLTIHWFTWFFGYTFTDAFLSNNNTEQQLILTPKHSIKGDLLFVVDGKWRIGWDYEYKSEQLLSTGLNSPSLFTTGVVVERTLENFVIFLNAENFTDVRQTRFDPILSGPNNTPQFTDIYAPLDGFFFNAGLKIKLD
jgi:iron complex outermembrane receptor protein